MEERGPGDSRSIESPPQPSDVEENPPVEREIPDETGSEGERVSQPGEGLVTEEGVNERETGAP